MSTAGAGGPPIAELMDEHRALVDQAHLVRQELGTGDPAVPMARSTDLFAHLRRHVRREEDGILRAMRTSGEFIQEIDLDLHVEREDLGIFPLSVVTLGTEGWATVDEAHTRSPSCLLDQPTKTSSPGPMPPITRRPFRNKEDLMQKESLTGLVRHHLETATTATSGRSAHTIYGGHEHVLRQTLIALRAGSKLDEHENPGEATLQVLHGRVTLVAGENKWNGSPGDLMTIPDSRHGLEAVEDSAVLLTVAMRS